MVNPHADPAGRLNELARWCCGLAAPAVEADFHLSGLAGAHVDATASALDSALAALAALEAGVLANRDENRMVGHYWLRQPSRAPTPEIGAAIEAALAATEELAAAVHGGLTAPPEGGRFDTVLLVGIGGSALGPMLAVDALAAADAPMRLVVLDNTDPDGIDRTLRGLDLRRTLALVISKSGGTPETRNGMVEVMRACTAAGVDFARRAVAVTTAGSALHLLAEEQQWRAILPMWDWVGGRTSITAAVGLLPMALCGIDIRAFLAGAAAMDAATRSTELRGNPAAMLALWWFQEGGGRGDRALVVLPYKDRLLLLSRYLQQLVMESLGKRLDRGGRVVEQGLTVYGNKGSTDQHAYVQQLRDGRRDFSALFVRVLHDRDGISSAMDPGDAAGATAGDYLDGFLLGTRAALFDNGRHSVTITVARLDPPTLGALIALFERAVGLYAELIDVNAYHQPGVEAGKAAAKRVLEIQTELLRRLDDVPRSAGELAAAVPADPAVVWAVLEHLAANRADVHRDGGAERLAARFYRR